MRGDEQGYRAARLTLPLLLLGLGWLAGCAGPPPPDCPSALAGHDVVYVLGRGWHTQIGLPAEQLSGGLAVFRTIFPGAQTVMFGYGKRTFMVAPANDVSEMILGPAPGPAVIEAVGLNAAPSDAYGTQGMVELALPPGGAAKLAAFVWHDLAHGDDGEPRLVAPGHFPGSLFYAARSRYDLLHTCNTWVAETLHAAGLPVDADWLMFSGQTMARVGHAKAGQCRTAPQTATGGG